MTAKMTHTWGNATETPHPMRIASTTTHPNDEIPHQNLFRQQRDTARLGLRRRRRTHTHTTPSPHTPTTTLNTSTLTHPHNITPPTPLTIHPRAEADLVMEEWEGEACMSREQQRR